MTETQSNTVAIAELTQIAKQTSKDVDKLIQHWTDVPEVRVISLEKRMKDVEEACNKRSWWAFTTIVTILGFFAYQHFFGSN